MMSSYYFLNIYYMPNKINIIFDVDETLIHTVYDDWITINKETKHIITNNRLTLIRDYCSDLLDFCFKHFNVGFWSTGTPKHILPIIKNVVPDKDNYKKINLLLCRTHWDNKHTTYQNLLTKKKYKIVKYNDNLVKPLDFLFTHTDFKRVFNIKNTLLIDDNPAHVGINPYNCIYIPKYCYENNDTILLELLIWFDKNKNKNNIKDFIKLFYNLKGEGFNCFRNTKSSRKLKFGDYVSHLNDDCYIIKIHKNNKYDIYNRDKHSVIKNIKI